MNSLVICEILVDTTHTPGYSYVNMNVRVTSTILSREVGNFASGFQFSPSSHTRRDFFLHKKLFAESARE